MTTDYNEIETIIIDFIKTYTHNSGCTDLILGLSGGIDSAVVAALLVKAVGKEHVTALILPDKATPPQDLTDAETYAQQLDITSHIINIDTLVEQHIQKLPSPPTNMAKANIKARIRMIQLFSIANTNNALVCGTSNKSELLIGYFTKYGDGGVDLQPIADLYKTQIFALAQHLKLPQCLIDKAPTAGLLPDQTDEQEIGMTYQTLDTILIGLEKKQEPQKIAQQANTTIEEVQRIHNLRLHSQHKRRLPLIVKLGGRTSGIDWRVPLQEG